LLSSASLRFSFDEEELLSIDFTLALVPNPADPQVPMGAIENGRIKGLLPEKTLFAVNYPGYPSSLERAVETLGGQEAISKVCLESAFSSISWPICLYEKIKAFSFLVGVGTVYLAQILW
jgi:hypothetical protein